MHVHNKYLHVLKFYNFFLCHTLVRCIKLFLIVALLQSNVLRGGASLAKLVQLEEFLNYLRSRTEALDGIGELGISTDDEGENQCCICYACDCDAFFEPCHHRSCLGCITRHLLNSQRCFFCNAKVTAVTRVDLKDCKLEKLV